MSIHYIQIIDNRKELSSLRKKCMRSLKDKIRPEDIYEVIKVEYDPDIDKLIKNIDTIKLSKAAEIPNLCVVDTDCFISKPLHDIDIQTDTPYFAQYNFNDSHEIPDIFYFYVNNMCEYFKNNLNPNKVSNINGYSVKIDVLKSLKDFKYIPDETFLHTYETMSDIVVQQKMNDLSREFEPERMELAMLRKSVEQMAMIMKTYESMRKVKHRG